MKLFKKVIAVLAIATMSLSMVACGTSKAATEMGSKDEKGLIVARVGDVPIYKTTLENEMARYGMTDSTMKMYYGEDYTSNAEVVAQYNDFKDNIINSLIEAEVLVFKAKDMKEIKVTEDEVNEQLEATKAQFESEEAFNSALKQTGMTLEDLKENTEKSLYVTKLIEYYAENKVEVTDEDVQKYYNENIANYTTKPGANIYHILVDSEEKAKEVLEKYNAGTSFADLAAKYGKDGTKDVGGSLGYIEYDTQNYDADFMAAAKKLGEGEVSQPVKTQFGWHIIKVDGIQKEEVVQPFEEVKESIQTMLKTQKAEEALIAELPQWKEEYKVTRYEENYKTEVTEPKETPAASDDANTEKATNAEKATSSEDGAQSAGNTEAKASEETNAQTTEGADANTAEANTASPEATATPAQ